MRDLSKQSFLGQAFEEVLRTKKLGFFGINGGGSHLVQLAANIGFKNYVLCDPGRIDEKKLNRNVLATMEHAQRNDFKVDIARDRILSLNPDAEVLCIRDKWQKGVEQGALDGIDVIMSAVDTFFERDQIERFCREIKRPLIDIGMDLKRNSYGGHYIFGQAIMTFPNGPCMRCLGYLTDERLAKEAENYGDAGDRPQVVWPNGNLASTAISFLMNYLFNWSGGRPDYIYRQYDGNSFTTVANEHARILVDALSGKCCHY